jgi:transketolase
VKKTGCIVTAEEHMRNGGLGDAVAQLLSTHFPVPQAYVAVNDSFGESGTPNQLMKKYHLESHDIFSAAQGLLKTIK